MSLTDVQLLTVHMWTGKFCSCLCKICNKQIRFMSDGVLQYPLVRYPLYSKYPGFTTTVGGACVEFRAIGYIVDAAHYDRVRVF